MGMIRLPCSLPGAASIMGFILTSIWWVLHWICWPIRVWWQHFGSYIFGSMCRTKDSRKVYEVRFCHYGDTVYFLPMVLGSFVLALIRWLTPASPEVLMFVWWGLFAFSLITITQDLNIWKMVVVALLIVGAWALSYVSMHEIGWDFLVSLGNCLRALNATASAGFFTMGGLVFTVIVAPTLIVAWLNHRVKIDYKYVYEFRFMRKTSRLPIFARGVERDISDLGEWIVMGAADIRARTERGTRNYQNVPGAGRRLAEALDSVLDYKPPGSVITAEAALDQTVALADPGDAGQEHSLEDTGHDGDDEDH